MNQRQQLAKYQNCAQSQLGLISPWLPLLSLIQSQKTISLATQTFFEATQDICMSLTQDQIWPSLLIDMPM